MDVEVIAVGDELLIGDVVNGNAAWIGAALTDAGLEVTRSAVVGDDEPTIAAALLESLRRCPAVVMTGGLGPTQDDLTREALAAAAGVELVRDESLAEALLARYASLGRRVPAMNLRQANLPAGARAVPNPVGSAPGIAMELGQGVVYALPGVPHEMQAMLTGSVIPELLARAGAPAVIARRVLHTAGMWESAVAEALADLHERLTATPGAPSLAWLAGRGQTRVRITARAGHHDAAVALIAPVETEIRERLGIAVWGADEDTLPAVVQRLLAERGQTVAVAESLTGGLLGAALTETPGSSATFRGGVIAYATDLKASLLGATEVQRDGAVSEATAMAMARGARERAASTYGISLTGVAGPEPQDGLDPGTVVVGLAGPGGERAKVLRLPGDRARVRQLAVGSALDLLRRELLDSGAR